MGAEAAGCPEASHVRRLTKDKFSVGSKRLKPVDSFHQLRLLDGGNALYTAFEQTLKARGIKMQHRWIRAIRNCVNSQGRGIALVAADNHAFSILAEIDQFIGVTQIGHAAISCQLTERPDHSILVL